MKKQTTRKEESLVKLNRESINFGNLLKCWIKLKTIDSNHLNFGLVNEKRAQLQKLLFEKSLLALDAEFLGLEQKFFYLIGCLDTRSCEFRKEFCRQRCGEEAIDREFVSNRSPEFWRECVHTNIQHHQTYELIKLNLTDLLAQWTRVHNEIWTYNDQFQNQIWFKFKLEQFKRKIRSYQYLIVYRLVVNLFGTMQELIRTRNFERREEFLELLQAILLQLTIEIELYFRPKLGRQAGHECFSITIIKTIAYLNSKRCNLNFLATKTVPLKRSCIDLIGCLKDGDRRGWFADLNDLGLIDVNRKLFEKFTDHSYRSWFQPADDQSSFDSSADRSVDKSIDQIYDKTYDKKFDRVTTQRETADKRSDPGPSFERMVVPSKFNDLVSKQQILSVSYQSLQLISSEPNSRIIDYLERVYWTEFWVSLSFHIQHSSRKEAFQSMIRDEEIEAKSGQFQRLLENIKSDFLIERMYQQFYEFKQIAANRKEELISKWVAYVSSVCRLCADQLIRVNTERQKTNSAQFIAQIEETFNSVAKTVERVDHFTSLEELIFVLTQIEPMTNKVRLIESSYSAERDFHYATFFSAIQVHLSDRLELILEYKICQAINKNYSVSSSPTGLKPSDWMQRLIDEVFRSISRFRSRPQSQPQSQLQSASKPANASSPVGAIQSKIEQLYIRKFNLFLVKIYDLTLRQDRKSIEPLREALQAYMSWVAGNYAQHVNTNNFPNYFLEILEQNYVHFEGGRFEGGNQLVNGGRFVEAGRFANGGLFDAHPYAKSPVPSRSSLIRGNQIAPQSVYESSSFESASYTNLNEQRDGSFRKAHFKSDVSQRLRISNRKTYLKMFFCFDNVWSS